MALIDLATNVIFPAALTIFSFGLLYNIFQYIVMPGGPRTFSPSRKVGVVKKVSIPLLEWVKRVWFILKKDPLHAFSSIFLFHIPILALIFLSGPHQVVLFNILPILEPILKPFRITQQFTDAFIANRTIWGPFDIIFNSDFLAILSIFGLVIILFYRITRHITGEFKSTIGDYFALILVLLVVLFGYLSVHSVGADYYQLYLFLHISFASFLIAYIPFSKFFHFVWSHWVNVVKTIIHDLRKGI